MGLEDRDGRYLDESREVGSAGGTNPRNRGAESKRKNFHPTVKPITLMSYLVTLGSRKDDVVLDPFMGSGTTPISCVTLDRKYLGIEKEKEYFEIAESRVENAINPANLVKHEFF
jgi:site-specific DNA-methyltransferase (adenine-specific)